MMTTRFPCALMNWSSGISSPSIRRFDSVRYSIAKWMPFSSRPGTGRSRGHVRAAGEHDGVELGLSAASAGHVDADVDAGPELDPFLLHDVRGGGRGTASPS